MKSRATQPFALARALVAGFLLMLAIPGLAETDEPEIDWLIPVGFVILRSTPDYAEARRVAEHASAQLSIPLDLRGLIYDPAHGLTWPREQCEKDPLYPFPCYLARGRYDPGVYLSIERSDSYSTFRPGFFVVIAASGKPGSVELTSTLAKVQAAYPDAYIREHEVYHGCMH